MKKIPKSEALNLINVFFKNIATKSPKEIKKIHRLAMSVNIPLREYRKTFCKKCLSPYLHPKIRIKSQTKSVVCEHCGYAARWKVK